MLSPGSPAAPGAIYGGAALSGPEERRRAVATDAELRLARTMRALIDATEELRQVLLTYQTVSAEVVTLVEQGRTLASALEVVEGPLRRRSVTEALASFEAARHEVRLAMFTLGRENGTSASELGRQLGISRQLSARLAREADEVAPHAG